jgi:hypothetical protein
VGSLRKPWYDTYTGVLDDLNQLVSIHLMVTVEIESIGIKVRANARSKFGLFDDQTKRINRSIFF